MKTENIGYNYFPKTSLAINLLNPTRILSWVNYPILLYIIKIKRSACLLLNQTD